LPLTALYMLTSIALHGQPGTPADNLEIRGTVVEPNPAASAPAAGIGGVQVKLTEYQQTNGTLEPTVIATTITDSQGGFSFHPPRFATYMVEVEKEGYTSQASSTQMIESGLKLAALLTRAQPTAQLQFKLTRPGELTGRVVDDDGKPVGGLHVEIYTRPVSIPIDVTTNGEGYFTSPKLIPGQYLVHVKSRSSGPSAVSPFSEADLTVADQDFESVYWPGVPDLRSATPITVSPGALNSIAAIRLHWASFPRVHVSVAEANCAPDTKWRLAIQHVDGTVPTESEILNTEYVLMPCSKDFLIRDVAPGAYWFGLLNTTKDPAERWALARVDVARTSVDVAMAMYPASEITGRFVPAEGVKLPAGRSPQIWSTPWPTVMTSPLEPTRVDPAGTFVFSNRLGLMHQMIVLPSQEGYYAQTIRVNGAPVAGRIITLTPGTPAQVEIVIDDKPANLTASVVDGDKPVADATVVLVKWPLVSASPPGSAPPPVLIYIQDGVQPMGVRTQTNRVAPGEYRAFAITPEAKGKIGDLTILERLAREGQRVKLERGESQTITLKLSDPGR